MSFYAWRWSPSDEDFIPEARFLTKADGEAYIAEVRNKYVDGHNGAILEERPGDAALFDAYQKSRKLLREWRARQ